MKLYIYLILLFILPINATATDLGKEKRWAEQVVDSIIDGEAQWLDNGTHHFLAINMQAEENKNRSIIIMHGTGVHPNWEQVIQPLRVALTESNWNTLSIQMPVLSNDAEHIDYAPLYDEVAPRINAAIDYLLKNGTKEIVLIGHSQGSTMAAYYLSTSSKNIKGFVAIGLSSFGKDDRMNSTKSLEKIKTPIIDIYGDEDLKEIIHNANLRVAAAKKGGNKNFTQIKIKGNHFYDGQNELLIKTIETWLESL